MSLETLFVFALSIALLYIKPGPNQAMKITRTLNDGFMPAWFFTLGATSTVMFYFAIAGLSASVAAFFVGAIGFYFKIFGAAYLFYMGYKGYSNINKGLWKGRVDHANKRDLLKNYMIGVSMTLANPITIFYFVGIVPSLIPLGTLSIGDIITGALIIFMVGNFADILLISLVAQVKEAVSDTKYVRFVNIFSSTGYILIGLFFLYTAFFVDQYHFKFSVPFLG